MPLKMKIWERLGRSHTFAAFTGNGYFLIGTVMGRVTSP